MALVAVDGTPLIRMGLGQLQAQAIPGLSATTLDAAGEAVIVLGRVVTSDGGSHTLNTTGSSSIGWRTGAVTFANGGTTVKIGLAAVDTGAGPPGRAANAADVVTFDVSSDLVGGGGGITGSAWQTSVPTTGTKTVANGDFIALAIQMTARGGADSVGVVTTNTGGALHRPVVTSFLGGVYATASTVPDMIITFADGALGYFYGSDIASQISTRTWNSGSSPSQFGQLYQFAFPVRIYGVCGWVDPDADFTLELFSDPLGATPVSERSIAFDANTMASATGRMIADEFATPYDTTADQIVAAVFTPGGSNISAYYKTLASATHRLADIGGTDSYGISRSGGSGAFANANSSLDHYYIGLLVGAFDNGAGGGLATPCTRSPMFG